MEFPNFAQGNHLKQINTDAFRCIRAENFICVKHNTGEIEYYDLLADPYELSNAASKIAPEILFALHSWLAPFQNCAAEDCRKIEDPFPGELENH